MYPPGHPLPSPSRAQFFSPHGPPTPTHTHFTPLATPTTPHFLMSPGAVWGRPGENLYPGGVVGAPPQPNGHNTTHNGVQQQQQQQYTQQQLYGGGSPGPGFFGMTSMMSMPMSAHGMEEPKGYFDFPPAGVNVLAGPPIARVDMDKEILRDGTVERRVRDEQEAEADAEREAETDAEQAAREEDDSPAASAGISPTGRKPPPPPLRLSSAEAKA
ncbi:hypothetical protein C8J57DRAFT_1371332 [Mycena rebaudengoi]|nr:hypothetical protein C8J57DRAFT_1371332 [Mycena rebaudengoi]